jgi:putative hydrolase of the HAD superfamily
MNIKGLVFDINGTLIDINTNEGYEEIYRVISNLLSYQGIGLSSLQVRDLYYQTMKEQRRSSQEPHRYL